MISLRKILLLALIPLGLGSLGAPSEAQTDSNPVAWTARLDPPDARPGEGARVLLTGTIKTPWYIYSPSTGPGGPVPTTIDFESSSAKWTGKIVQPPPIKRLDSGFNMEVQVYEKSVTFSLPVQLGSAKTGKGSLSVRYQTCNHRLCLPPKKVRVPLTYTLKAGPARSDRKSPVTTVPATVAFTPPGSSELDESDPTEPSSEVVTAGSGVQDQSLLPYLGLAFISGLASLLTPCVFPMIPITVSLFAKRSEEGASRWSGPLAYCGGIVGTFTVLGIAASIVAKAAAIPNLAANPWFNGAMGVLFVALGLNLLGVYEIIVPAKLANIVQPRGKQGLALPFLMGIAATITSFTCTAPFVGTALISAASGGGARPALGMLAYSLAFALPFFLLALFPAAISKLPRAGEWLVSVKATMGFVELAAALKFFQQADFTLQLGWITRPLFLSVWFALAVLAALYLLRWIHLPNHPANAPVGPTRRVLGAGFAGVAGILLAANNGLNLRDFEGYLPPSSYGEANAAPTAWLKDNFESALKLAKEQNKPVLVNFTGYACTNCRVMEENVLPTRQVTSELTNFVPVFLHTDGPDAKSQKNSALQQKLLNTVAIPVYAVLTPDGQLKGRLDGLERDPGKFVDFLKASRESIKIASIRSVE